MRMSFQKMKSKFHQMVMHEKCLASQQRRPTVVDQRKRMMTRHTKTMLKHQRYRKVDGTEKEKEKDLIFIPRT